MCEHFSRIYFEKPHNQALVPTQKAGRHSLSLALERYGFRTFATSY
jgi:hypothetical protein